MSKLSSKIKLYLDREVNFTKDVILQDDMISGVSNPYIKEWNVAEAQPTEAQLNALESQADELETANKVISNRKAAYPSLNDFAEAYTEKEIGGDSTKMDAYKIKYEKVRSDNPK